MSEVKKNYKIEIDWKVVDDLFIAGCPGTEVAGRIGCHPDTLYKRIEDKYDTAYSAYLQEKRSKGDALLRAHQYAKALGLTDKGDNTLLIWLGKCRLKQRDTDQQDLSPHHEALSRDDVNFKLQAENALLKQKLAENAN